MNRKRYSFKILLGLLVLFILCGCVGKKPDDDVALIKQMLAKFERGINQKSTVVLDSIILDRKQNIANLLIDSLSYGIKLDSVRIVSKMFVVVKDSAEVRLKLGLRLGLRLSSRYTIGIEKSEEIEKQIQLFLHKKRGKWRINSFKMEHDIQ